MSQEIVRCPYCVLGSEFRPMFLQTTFHRSKKSFICVSCGHKAAPEDPYSKCPCARCHNLNRIASRLSRERAALTPAPSA